MYRKDLLYLIQSLPDKPGIYKYSNKAGVIIYVGKAKNLKKRVKSYFFQKLDPSSKTALLVEQIHTISHIETASEFEALVLEAELIKRYQPKYNIVLKDDKSYLYIVIRLERLKVGAKVTSLPRLLLARFSDIQVKDKYYGPYPDSSTARFVFRSLRKFLPFRDCTTSKFYTHQRLRRPCLYGQLNLCQAPCVSKVSVQDYKNSVKKVAHFLSGNTVSFITSLKRSMQRSSAEQNFEEAAHVRDLITKYQYVTSAFKAPQRYIDNPYLVDDMRGKALRDLVDTLPMLAGLPVRIECYDISNLLGSAAVGSLVCALNGELTKSLYKRFKIKTKTTPDDFYMMYEVLKRRLKRGIKNQPSWELPDLLVVDGGKGQVTSALKVLNELNLAIPVVGIAKRLETFVYFDEKMQQFVEVNLPKDNEGLKLIQRLRDEAHRFAKSYHHKLRLKDLIVT